MHVVAINGSPKAEGNTYQALKLVAAELEQAGISCEIIQVGHQAIHGCTACVKCVEHKNERCVIRSDAVNEVLQKMKQADGIILGSPVYFSGIAGAMKCFLDRSFYTSSANGNLFRGKVGAAVVAVRRSGGTATFDQLNHYLNYAEMFLPASNYWNIIHGAAPGEVLQDEEGVQIMRILGKNFAHTLKLIETGQLEMPQQEAKIRTNFIR